MTKTVVILGGAFAGVQIAHRLLKYTQPHVKDLKVILVSKVSPSKSKSNTKQAPSGQKHIKESDYNAGLNDGSIAFSPQSHSAPISRPFA